MNDIKDYLKNYNTKKYFSNLNKTEISGVCNSYSRPNKKDLIEILITNELKYDENLINISNHILFLDTDYYNGLKEIEPLLEKLNFNGNNFSREMVFEEGIIIKNNKLCNRLISDTGYWKIKNLNEHYFDKGLAYGIYQFFSKINSDNEISEIIDFGCGDGSYLQYLENKIPDSILLSGFDGNPYTSEISCGFGETRDLTEEFIIERIPKTKLFSICLEVGEHIPKDFEKVFLNNLTENSDFLILSWGIPGQGGFGHVNCKQNSYIINKILDKGFKYLNKDSKFLRRKAEAPWFKKTIMIFKKND